MVQKNFVLLVRHAETTATDRRAHLDAERPVSGSQIGFSYLSHTEASEKYSRNFPDGPYEKFLSDHLQN